MDAVSGPGADLRLYRLALLEHLKEVSDLAERLVVVSALAGIGHRLGDYGQALKYGCEKRAFLLDDADKALIAQRRGDHNRLGFALQLITVRYLGLFLADPLDVPNAVMGYLAEQMAVADSSCVKRYFKRAP